MDISLEKFHQERIKAGGKAGALGNSISVSREKSKITVISNTNFSKRNITQQEVKRIDDIKHGGEQEHVRST
ncbi:hypothetical protein V2J09_007857 [Rumex salicifolius]